MKGRLKSRYVKLGLTIIAAGIFLILFYYLVTHHKAFFAAVSTMGSILAPFTYGFVMAYLLRPVYNWTVRNVYRLTENSFRKKRNSFIFAKVIGTAAALLILISVITGFFALLLPELFRSVAGIIRTLPEKLSELVNWAKGLLSNYPEIADIVEKALTQAKDAVVKWAESDIMPRIGAYMSHVTEGIMSTVRTFASMFIGVFVCVYLLNGKEIFIAELKKAVIAAMSQEHSDRLFQFARFTDKTFGGFISGKIVDSTLVGILCLILMSLMGLPYPVLISTIIGVTDVIPFFGPFIGAIPSAIIIFFVSPVQALYFILMILALQQLDGNVIAPKILGRSTKLAGLWVMFAIIVSGGLFGFIGMVLGVPVFSLIYYYTMEAVDKKLDLKGKATATADYENLEPYNINGKDVL